MCDIKVTFHHKIFGHQLFAERDRFPSPILSANMPTLSERGGAAHCARSGQFVHMTTPKIFPIEIRPIGRGSETFPFPNCPLIDFLMKRSSLRHSYAD